MRLALIFNTDRADTTGGYFARACQQLGIAHEVWPLQQVDQIPKGFDLYLRVDHGDDYEVCLPDGLGPTAFLAIDTHLKKTWPKIARLARAFDFLFCVQRLAAERLGGVWLPVACDLDLHGASSRHPVADIAFVGTDGGIPRKFVLQALRERYSNSVIGAADFRQIGPIYSRARLGFNYSIAGDVNMRVFEVLAAGAMLLTDARPGDDLARLGLLDRQHLVLYRDPGEIFELADHYLREHAAREAIARAGTAAVRAGHTYADRLRQLLAVVGLLPVGTQEVRR